jgi:peptidoglycan/xylan/chitin deacetylase (PgdA/CDA1 family)
MTGPDDRSRRRLAAAARLGAVAWGLYCLPGLAAIWRPLRPALGVEDRTPGRTGVALTFDDGPHPQGTPAILEVLAQRGWPATFFLVGEQVERNSALAAEVVAAGHGVGLHCHRHRNLLRLGPGQVNDDLRRATAVIEDTTQRRPRLYRPPYGILNAAALGWARRAGMRPLLWTQWGRDWDTEATPGSIAGRVLDGVGPGAVLLLHDADYYSAAGSWRRTAAALPVVLDELERLGLSAEAPG